MFKKIIYVLAAAAAFLALFFNGQHAVKTPTSKPFKRFLQRPGSLTIEEYLAQIS